MSLAVDATRVLFSVLVTTLAWQIGYDSAIDKEAIDLQTVSTFFPQSTVEQSSLLRAGRWENLRTLGKQSAVGI